MNDNNKYISIPHTDIHLFCLVLGTANAGVKYDEKEFYEILEKYIYYGGNIVDTASVYSDWVCGEKSRSEKLIGNWIQKENKRKDLIILTKGGHPTFIDGIANMHKPRLDIENMRNDLENSLRNLKTDYIDIYCFHRDDRTKEVDELIDMMETFRKEGKIRYYACSNWDVERIKRADEYCSAKGYRGFIANECMYNIACQYVQMQDSTLHKIDEAMIRYHMKNKSNIPIAYSSNCSGFLYHYKDKQDDMYRVSEAIKLAQIIENFSKESRYSITQIALSYIYNMKISCIPIYEPKNFKQIEEIMKWIRNCEFSKNVEDIMKRIQDICRDESLKIDYKESGVRV